MDSPYKTPATNDPLSSPAVDSNVRGIARVLGGTAVFAGVVAAFIGYSMRGMVDSPPAYWAIFEWAAGLLPGGLIIMFGGAAIMLSFGERRSWMLRMGFVGVILALGVIVTQMWVSGMIFTLSSSS